MSEAPRPRVRTAVVTRPTAPSATFAPPPAPAPAPVTEEPQAPVQAAPAGPRKHYVTMSAAWHARVVDDVSWVLERADRRYRMTPDLIPVQRVVSLTFPVTFLDETLRGASIPLATVFAERPGSEFPLWVEFAHPLDGRVRSVFARPEWVQG